MVKSMIKSHDLTPLMSTGGCHPMGFWTPRPPLLGIWHGTLHRWGDFASHGRLKRQTAGSLQLSDLVRDSVFLALDFPCAVGINNLVGNKIGNKTIYASGYWGYHSGCSLRDSLSWKMIELLALK